MTDEQMRLMAECFMDIGAMGRALHFSDRMNEASMQLHHRAKALFDSTRPNLPDAAAAGQARGPDEQSPA